jgi:hypothetical protein
MGAGRPTRSGLTVPAPKLSGGQVGKAESAELRVDS